MQKLIQICERYISYNNYIRVAIAVGLPPMAEMIDKVFSTSLAGQMTGFYDKQKMLRKLNNKLEMNN